MRNEPTISYYPKGELIGLVLDLLIRGKTNGNSSLDDVMRRMYDEFYLKSPNATYYLRGRGYTSEDFQRVASETSGFDLTDFFQRYVRGVELLPYDEALAYVGMHLVRAQAREPFNAGIGVDWGKGKMPAYRRAMKLFRWVERMSRAKTGWWRWPATSRAIAYRLW